MHIVVEGNTGVGKTEQVELLAERFREANYSVTVVDKREVVGDRMLEEILQMISLYEIDLPARTEALMRAGYLAQLHESVVQPALRSGDIVIQETSVDTIMALTGFGRGIGPSEVAQIAGWALAGKHPDITFVLDGLPNLHSDDIGDLTPESEKNDLDMRNRFLLLNGWQSKDHVLLTAKSSPLFIHHDVMRHVMEKMSDNGKPFAISDPLEEMYRAGE